MSGPRKTPAQQRSRFTYEVILEAAAHIFDQEGMSATTNRIAEHAGVSIGSLYQYFPNKQALLHELALRHIERAEAAFTQELLNLRAAPPDVGKAVTRLVTLAVDQNGPLTRLHQLMREHAPRTPQLERRYQQFITTTVDNVLAYLDLDDSEIRLRIELAVAALDGQIHAVVLDTTSAEERDRRTALIIEQATQAVQAVLKPPSTPKP